MSIQDLNKKGKFIDRFSEKFVNTSTENKQQSIGAYLSLVNAIWKISDAIGDTQYKGWSDDKKKNQGNFKVKSLIEGRNIADGKAYRLEDDIEGKNSQNVYVADSTDKLSLMKYAVATGREEEVGKYLKCAGFWKDNLVHKNLEKENLISRTDWLFLYAIKYRDALVKKWADNSTEYKEKVEKNFPFIKLLMIINRDILFVAERILLKDDSLKKYKMKSLKKELIYYVKEDKCDD